MCGRFTLRAPASTIAAQFGLFEMPELAARFNIAPSQMVPVVRMNPAQAEQRQLAWLRWGLIPSWAKDPGIGKGLINARAETAAEKPAFRAALRRRRCLVLADGFYEWQAAGRSKKPWFFRLRDDRPFGLAGLWEAWEGGDAAAVESCTILTTDANSLVQPVHNRMPVIVSPEDYARWLDPAVQDPLAVADMLRPYPPEAMLVNAVSPHVNSPANEGPQCLAPTAELF